MASCGTSRVAPRPERLPPLPSTMLRAFRCLQAGAERGAEPSERVPLNGGASLLRE